MLDKEASQRTAAWHTALSENRDKKLVAAHFVPFSPSEIPGIRLPSSTMGIGAGHPGLQAPSVLLSSLLRWPKAQSAHTRSVVTLQNVHIYMYIYITLYNPYITVCYYHRYIYI